jgi:hypothetical protein
MYDPNMNEITTQHRRSKNIVVIGGSLSIFFLVCGLVYQRLLHTTGKLINFGELARQVDQAHHNYGAEILAAILTPLLLIAVPIGLGLAIAYGLAKIAR